MYFGKSSLVGQGIVSEKEGSQFKPYLVLGCA